MNLGQYRSLKLTCAIERKERKAMANANFVELGYDEWPTRYICANGKVHIVVKPSLRTLGAHYVSSVYKCDCANPEPKLANASRKEVEFDLNLLLDFAMREHTERFAMACLLEGIKQKAEAWRESVAQEVHRRLGG